MEKTITLLLSLVLSLSLCACRKGNTQIQQNSNESAPFENADAIQIQVDYEYLSLVCGSWDFSSGWRDLGWVLEFRDNGTCTINEEELNWDVTLESKQWLDGTKEFVNIYSNNELVYEAHISIAENRMTLLVISEKDDSGLGIMPAGTYIKLGDNEQPMTRNEE